MLIGTHDRVREARHALNAVAATLIGAAEAPEDAAEIRALLGDIDAGLKRSRSALQDAVEGLAVRPRER
jgi:hypothetical protein